MPHSDNSLRPNILMVFDARKFSPKTVLDVGCGAGANLEFYQPWWDDSHWTGLEIFAPYVERFFLFDRYDSLIIGDVRQITDLKYDLIIFGDVLEHMIKHSAQKLLDRALDQAQYVVVALPVIHYPQGHIAGNPYEEHVSEWSYEELANHPLCVYSVRNEVTGSFLFEGRNNAASSNVHGGA